MSCLQLLRPSFLNSCSHNMIVLTINQSISQYVNQLLAKATALCMHVHAWLTYRLIDSTRIEVNMSLASNKYNTLFIIVPFPPTV